MAKEFGLGFDQHLHMLSPTLNQSGLPFMNGDLNTEPAHRYPHAVVDTTSKNLSFKPDYGFHQSKASEEIKNWFCHKPHFQQAFAPVLNSASEETFPVGQSDIGLQKIPVASTIPPQKRFLVFDQSGDKTTLLYSSRVHSPIHFGACRAPSPPTTHNLTKEEMRNSDCPLRLSLNDDDMENNLRDVTEDEIRENTEELDALLCSDDDTYSSEDDETSTGHSPSTMTASNIPKPDEETGEEVNSFYVPTKRQKLLKTFAGSELESDAESICDSRKNEHKEEIYPRSGCKRSRKERIHETVSILQSIIPDTNGKDAVVVIDHAIHYLRSLKAKAEALGLDSI